MAFLLLVVLFVPVIAVWISVALGIKIRKNTAFRNLGTILIWVPVASFLWNTVLAISLINVRHLPDSVKVLVFAGNWFGYFTLIQVFLGPIVTVGAAAIAVRKGLYLVHSILTILFCMCVTWWLLLLMT